MNRRHAVLAALALGAPRIALAQSGRMRRIGIVVPTPGDDRRYAALMSGMRRLGWIEGQNLAVEWRHAEARYEHVVAMTQDLINAGAEVIITNSTPAVVNARKASATIPIVAAAFGDPVASGLVASLASPGGNVTGVSIIFDGILDKVFELAVAILPRVARAAVLYNPRNQISLPAAQRLESLFRKAGAASQKLEAGTAQELEAAFAAITRERSEALVATADPFLFGQRQRLAEFCKQRRVAAFGQAAEFVAAGFLASYGADFNASFAGAASFVSRILRGAKPAELPIEQATKVELCLNLNTARALGLQIPQSVLLRADLVVE